LRDYAPRLRSRAEIGEFDAHPSELGRVLHRADVLATGISVGEAVGLLGPASAVEVYAPVSHRRAIVDEHALSPAAGLVCIRWVLDEMWPVLTRRACVVGLPRRSRRCTKVRSSMINSTPD